MSWMNVAMQDAARRNRRPDKFVAIVVAMQNTAHDEAWCQKLFLLGTGPSLPIVGFSDFWETLPGSSKQIGGKLEVE